jgi:hypothetical protein
MPPACGRSVLGSQDGRHLLRGQRLRHGMVLEFFDPEFACAGSATLFSCHRLARFALIGVKIRLAPEFPWSKCISDR